MKKEIKVKKMDPSNHDEYSMPATIKELHLINDASSLLVSREFKLELAPLRDLSTTAEVGTSLKFLEKIGVAILELESIQPTNLKETVNVNLTVDELLTIREIAVHCNPSKKYNPANTLKRKVLKLLFDESLAQKIKTSNMFQSINKMEDINE